MAFHVWYSYGPSNLYVGIDRSYLYAFAPGYHKSCRCCVPSGLCPRPLSPLLLGSLHLLNPIGLLLSELLNNSLLYSSIRERQYAGYRCCLLPKLPG